MSTNGYDSWAVDLAEVGAVYPFQGSEGLLAVVGVVLWLAWHVVQMRKESRDYEQFVKDHGSEIKAAIDDHE